MLAPFSLGDGMPLFQTTENLDTILSSKIPSVLHWTLLIWRCRGRVRRDCPAGTPAWLRCRRRLRSTAVGSRSGHWMSPAGKYPAPHFSEYLGGCATCYCYLHPTSPCRVSSACVILQVWKAPRDAGCPSRSPRPRPACLAAERQTFDPVVC